MGKRMILMHTSYLMKCKYEASLMFFLSISLYAYYSVLFIMVIVWSLKNGYMQGVGVGVICRG
jgi:hypothetical protein